MDVLLAWVEVWKMGNSLVLHDIRVLLLGQDTSRIILSRQCCTVMCFGFESLPYCCIVALSSLQSATSCVIPLLPCKRGKTKRGVLVSVWAREETSLRWRLWMISVVNETEVCDLSVLMAFSVSLLTDTPFCSRLWQHLWKTTQSTWFHQCSRSCPSSGTPLRKVLLYILGSEWVWLESNETSSVSYPVMTWLLEEHNTWSALPCQTKQDTSVTSGGSIRFLLA